MKTINDTLSQLYITNLTYTDPNYKAQEHIFAKNQSKELKLPLFPACCILVKAQGELCVLAKTTCGSGWCGLLH